MTTSESDENPFIEQQRIIATREYLKNVPASWFEDKPIFYFEDKPVSWTDLTPLGQPNIVPHNSIDMLQGDDMLRAYEQMLAAQQKNNFEKPIIDVSTLDSTTINNRALEKHADQAILEMERMDSICHEINAIYPEWERRFKAQWDFDTSKIQDEKKAIKAEFTAILKRNGVITTSYYAIAIDYVGEGFLRINPISSVSALLFMLLPYKKQEAENDVPKMDDEL